MAIDSVEATQGLQGGGSTGDVTIGIDPPVSRQNGGTGVSVVTATQLVNQLGAVPTSGGHMSGDLTVHTGIVVGTPADGNRGAGTVNAQNLLQVNASTATAGTLLPGTHLHIEADDNTRILCTSYGNLGAALTMRAAEGVGSGPLPLTNNAPIGALAWFGYGGGATPGWSSAARAAIRVVASQPWTDVNQGTAINILTTANNSTNTQTRMTVGQGVVVGSPSLGGDMAGAVNSENGFYENGTKLSAGGAGLPIEGGTLSNSANVTTAADLLTIRSSTTVPQSNQLVLDSPNTNNGAQIWAIGPGIGGSFNIYDRTAGGNPKLAISKVNGQIQFQNGNLNLDDATVPMQYVFRTVAAGSRQIGFATDASTPLEMFEINSQDVVITGDLEVGGTPVVSDRRLKQNIEPWLRGLDEVRQLNPIRYEYNARAGWLADGRTRVGLDADETDEVIPEMVGTRRSGELDGTPVKTITPDVLLFALTNAVKELADRLEALERSK